MLYHDDSQHIATTSAIKFSFLDILFIASKFFLDFSPGVRVICYRYLRYLFLFLFLFFFLFFFSWCYSSASTWMAGTLHSILPSPIFYHWALFISKYFICSFCLHSSFTKAVHLIAVHALRSIPFITLEEICK